MIDATTRTVLKWVDRRRRYHDEASSRWGHYYEDALMDGLISKGATEYIIGHDRRDIRTPIALTDTGRATLSIGDPT